MESWGQITDVYDLLARAILSEEGGKVLTNKAEDAFGAGWVMWNHAYERTNGERDPQANDLLAYLMQANHPIRGVWSYKLTRAAFDPGNHPTYYAAGDPNAGNKAYTAALNMAHLVVDGDPSRDDVTYGSMYYADAFADGRSRERTAFWKVWGTPFDSPTDPHLTIPQLRQMYAPMRDLIWSGRR